MSTNSKESGQAAIGLLAFFSLLLLTAAGLAVDVSNLWFHRQAAQSAADSACQAGALDLLITAAGSTPNSGFTPGQPGTCTATSTSSICKYASFNGYNSAGPASSSVSKTSAWNTVTYSFPASVSGATTPPSSVASTPYLNVSVTESVQTFLIELVNGFHYSEVTAQCTCGVAQIQEAAPVLVLDPGKDSFTYSGGASLNIIGGPSRGLQVNSSSTAAIACSGSAVINTSKGGQNYTGSDIGVVGNEPEGTNGCQNNGGYTGFNPGTTGHWRPNVLPVADPYAGVPVPASVKSMVPATYNASAKTYNTWVGYHIDGCPDSSAPAYVNGQTTNCAEFAPGYYPNGINVTSLVNSYSTVIFLPGVYYLNGSLTTGGSTTIRVGMPCWATPTSGYSSAACGSVSKAQGWNYTQGSGVMFYFLSGTYSVSGGQSGDKIDTVPSTALTCTGTAPASALGIPTTLSNNVLWSQCTKNGTYYDSGGDNPSDSAGAPGVRGLLFFQDHADTASPTFSGSGQLAFSGSLYFHANSEGDVLTLSGGSSSGTYVIGDIVTDQLSLSGSGAINLALPSAASTPLLKVAVFQ